MDLGRRDTSAWVRGALKQMGREAAEKAGLSQEAKGSWPELKKTVQIPPVLSSPSSPPPTLQTVTLPPCGFSLDHEEKLNLSLRSGLQKMPNIPFAILVWVFYGRNSFCGRIVFLLLQYLQVEGFATVAVGVFLLCLGGGFTGSCPSPVICTFIIQHQNNSLPFASLAVYHSSNVTISKEELFVLSKILLCMVIESFF